MTATGGWEPYAAKLAEQVAHPVSRWRPIIEATRRHVFVPYWWDPAGPDLWVARAMVSEPDRYRWYERAYQDRSLITQVDGRPADRAAPGVEFAGRPTSSATLPGLLVQMYRHAMLGDGMDVLDVGTGSGYGTALLSGRLGDRHVTSVDVDPYLVASATEALDAVGLHPEMIVADATGELPGTYDRIVATVGVRPIPASWLAALRPGGRLVTTIADTAIIITADRTEDGGAAGRVEWDRAGFMGSRPEPGPYPSRSAGPYPSRPVDQGRLPMGDGEDTTIGRHPVIDVREAWELWSMLSILEPGIEHHYLGTDGDTTAWMLHPDGSWARATTDGSRRPLVHQAGPRRLWDELDRLRDMWLRDGSLPLYGAKAEITPDGACHLRRGRWAATIG